MKILITGAAGFIGSHLMNRLLNMGKGYQVIGLDDFNSLLYDNEIKLDRLDHFDLINVSHVDITRKINLFSILEDEQPDLVIHLAAMAGVRDSFGKEELYHKVNIEGTWNVISCCKEIGIKNALYASTSSVYGGTKTLPWKENIVTPYQLNAYAYSKYVNECQFKMTPKINSIGMRFFTVYGPWGRPDMSLYQFTESILENESFYLYNYGNMKRDFTYISDVLDGICILIDRLMSQEKPIQEIYNIGNGKQTELMSYLKMIRKSLNMKGPPALLTEKHPADTLETWSDISKMSELGYKPKVDIEEGIEKFVNWYKNYKDKK